MGIRITTPLSEIDAYIERSLEKAKQAIIDRLCYIGSLCINEAREHGDYNNPTGNLRSSIGYVVVVDGQVYEKAIVEMTKNGTEGRKEADAFLSRLASEHKTGICLIVVAGMNYASYVEHGTKRNNYTPRNVLTSAKLLADRLVPQLLEQIGFKVSKK